MSRLSSRSFARSLPWSFCAALLAAACQDSSLTSNTGSGPGIVDLGLAAQANELAGDGDLQLVAAREFETGGHDLDGDGDAFDEVVYVLDLASGTAIKTALALDVRPGALLAAVRGPLAVFAASEASSGNRDLNGDGDANDSVLFVHDARTGTTRGLGLAVSVAPGLAPAIGGDLVAFSVSEAAQGADLDGDGATASDVLHVYDAATNTLLDTGLAAPSRLFVEDGGVAYFVAESSADLNGDGDRNDGAVLAVYDVGRRANQVSGLATDGAAPVFADGAWLVGVPEAAQARDLDGDGDLFDDVLHVFVPGSNLVRNLSLPCLVGPCAVASRPAQGQQLFGIVAAETDGVDRNGDGDLDDLVVALYDPHADSLLNTRVAAAALPAFSGRFLGFLGSEAGQRADLDGDGDLLDALAFVTDPATGLTTALAQEAIALRGESDFFTLARRESEARIDWNGDGDQADVVVHVYDPLKKLTTNTALASVDTFGATSDQLLLDVDETAQRADLNVDGDQLDQVFVLFDLATGKGTSLGLATAPDDARSGRLAPSGRFALLANERAQGRDLDGDGDLADDVVHRAQ